MKRTMHPLLFGLLGLLTMSAFYFALLATTTRDPLHPFFFFGEKWYFLAPIFIGFGAQMFLFQKLRIASHRLSIKTAGASAGTSGVAMAACCAHHFADIVPILGFMGIATFVTVNLHWFLALGAVTNVAGALYLWYHLRCSIRNAQSSSSCFLSTAYVQTR